MKIISRNKFYTILLLLILVCFCRVNAQSTFNDKIRIVDRISLENIFYPLTSINVDASDAFITTDAKKSKVHIYNNRGDVLYEYGRKGRGPRDFLSPSTTIRLTSGKLLTAEWQGKLSLFNSKGDSLLRVYRVKILPLTEIHQIGKNMILLVGRNRGSINLKLLHIFSLSKGSIIKSFMSLPFSIQAYGGVFAGIWNLTSASVYKDQIVATIAPFPKIKIFDLEGEYQKTISLPLKNFKKIKTIDSKRLLRKEYERYMTTFSMISDIYWLDNKLLIQYYRFLEVNSKAKETKEEFNLALLKPDGELIFELRGTPKLRAVSINSLYFKEDDPKSKADLIEARIVKNNR